MSMHVTKNGQLFYWDTNIDTIFNDLKLKKQASLADGHFMLHPVTRSLEKQIGQNDKHHIRAIKIEAMEEVFKYIPRQLPSHTLYISPKRSKVLF